MKRARLSRTRADRWKVKVQGQGPATAEVGSLGDAKRVGDAVAQQTLIWERRDSDHWDGREPTARDRYRARMSLS